MLGSVDGVLEGQAALRLDSDGLLEEGDLNSRKFIQKELKLCLKMAYSARLGTVEEVWRFWRSEQRCSIVPT